MNRLQIKFITDCLDNMGKLNEWENDFINSIAELPDHATLTAPQNSTLNKCIAKVNTPSNYSYGKGVGSESPSLDESSPDRPKLFDRYEE